MKEKINSIDNKLVREVDLNKSIFGVDYREDIISRMIRYQLAKRRSGNHKTKGISEISGSTKKPFKQKGTGSARQGSRRSPQMRGGAVIFGPQVRSHAHKLPKKIRTLALKIALSKKLKDGKLKIIDAFKIPKAKTSLFKSKLNSSSQHTGIFIFSDFSCEKFLSLIFKIFSFKFSNFVSSRFGISSTSEISIKSSGLALSKPFAM